jgi:osmotically-inducible protein OsmY
LAAPTGTSFPQHVRGRADVGGWRDGDDRGDLNHLQVRLLNDRKRGDAELRGDVLQALMLDSLVPSTVDAKVDDGFVTLTGTAHWKYQRDEAEHVASNIVGASDVVDEIELKPEPSAHDVKEDIESAFERNAKLDANDLHV